MLKFDADTRSQLINLYATKKISLEGNILKVINTDGDVEFDKYVNDSIDRDKETRRKRLDMTKQIQKQNRELLASTVHNELVQAELTDSLAQIQVSMQETERLRCEATTAKLEADEARLEAVSAKEAALAAKEESDIAKNLAINDLDIIQRRSQTELISTIVKIALAVIISVGVITTSMYCVALFTNKDTQIIGSTWSNMFGILLTNAFSIVGTIMGVKYASENKNNQ